VTGLDTLTANPHVTRIPHADIDPHGVRQAGQPERVPE